MSSHQPLKKGTHQERGPRVRKLAEKRCLGTFAHHKAAGSNDKHALFAAGKQDVRTSVVIEKPHRSSSDETDDDKVCLVSLKRIDIETLVVPW